MTLVMEQEREICRAETELGDMELEEILEFLEF